VQAATAARARVDAVTRPSQNEQQQSQQADHARQALRAQAGSAPGAGTPGYQGPVLPGGQLNPQFALQLQSLARNGKKIQAIKLLRQATHSDLLTAKNFVDRL
jgi:ribosomal protein L7/L12